MHPPGSPKWKVKRPFKLPGAVEEIEVAEPNAGDPQDFADAPSSIDQPASGDQADLRRSASERIEVPTIEIPEPSAEDAEDDGQEISEDGEDPDD